MIKFDKNCFKKIEFSEGQIKMYFKSAVRDFKIAKQDNFDEVKFSYCYQALIKAGIALIAKKGNVKVRSIPGHHIKILEKMSEIMEMPDIFTIGNAMRMKRNRDFYDGGEFISNKEILDYLIFVGDVIKKTKNFLE